MDIDINDDMQALDIAPEGDLILIVGEKLELRVHSFVMRLHVPDFFNALLGPNFAEGQTQGTAADPHSIELPDDGAQGMKLLCSILHIRSDLIDDFPSAASFRELAIVADKYDCVTKIQTQIENWMNMADIRQTDVAGSWLHALYILDDAENFSAKTAQLIRGYHDAHTVGNAFKRDNQQDETIHSIKASVISHARKQLRDICSLIDKAANPLIASLSSKFKHSVNEIPHIDRDPPEPDEMDDRTEWSQLEEQCTYLQRYALAQLEALVNANIFPPPSRPRKLQSLVDNIEAFKVADIKKSTRCCSDYGWCDDERTDDFPWDVEKMKETAAALNCALCLDCLKAGGWNDGECRVHPDKKKPAKK